IVTQGSPAELCAQLTKLICKRDDTCSGMTKSAQEEAACEQIFSVGFDCELATVMTSPDFATCLNDANAVSCKSLFPANAQFMLPPSCQDEIRQIPYSDAKMKCFSFAAAFCKRSLECSGDPVTQDNVELCVEVFVQDSQRGISCDVATAVGPGYDQ